MMRHSIQRSDIKGYHTVSRVLARQLKRLLTFAAKGESDLASKVDALMAEFVGEVSQLAVE